MNRYTPSDQWWHRPLKIATTVYEREVGRTADKPACVFPLVAYICNLIDSHFSTFCSYSSLAELKCIRSRNEEDRSYAQELAKSQRYSLQLERQLRELLQSPQGSGQLLNRFFFIKRADKLLSCDGGVLSEHLQAFPKVSVFRIFPFVLVRGICNNQDIFFILQTLFD